MEEVKLVEMTKRVIMSNRWETGDRNHVENIDNETSKQLRRIEVYRPCMMYGLGAMALSET